MDDRASVSVQHLQTESLKSVSWARHAKPVFLVALLLSTWLPMAFFLLSSSLETSMYGYAGTRTMLLFLGTAHVPATLFFYLDRDFSNIIRKHKTRYVYLPILLTVATGFLFAFATAVGQVYLLLAYWAWQAFHYGRQNAGIYSFVSIASRGVPSDKYERGAIELGTWCGIIGTFKVMGSPIAPGYLHGLFDTLYWLGGVAFFIVLLASLLVYLRNVRLQTPLLTIFYFTLVCFFLPVFLSTTQNIGFLSYAIAHGLQYILFMAVVSLNFDPQNAQKKFQFRNGIKLLIVVLFLGFIFYRAPELKGAEFLVSNTRLMTLVDFVIGAVLGATMAHFVIDAGAWRLSRPMQRAYIGKRFAFAFGGRTRKDFDRDDA